MRKFLLSVLFLTFCSAANADITTGLVGWWKFDEGSGSTALDSSGNGNSGNESNGPSYVGGKVGSNALSFNSAYIIMSESTALRPAQITLSCWIKIPTSTSYVIIEHAKSTWLSYGLLMGANPCVAIGYTNSSPYTINACSPGMYNDNNWHHVVGTYDLNNVKLYMDGALVATTPNTIPILYDSIGGDFTPRIGRHIDGTGGVPDLVGTVDDVRVYDRALSAADIAALYEYTGNAGHFFILNSR